MFRLPSSLSRLVRRLLLAAWMPLILGACSQFQAEETSAPLLVPVVVSAAPRQLPPEIAYWVQRPDDLWGRLAHGLSWEHDDALVAIEREKILSQPRFFEVLSQRAYPALLWVLDQVEARGLPMELALVPVIESMLDPWAYSSQRAAGLWQIIPATAAHYGLERNWWYDARLDIPVATDFALGYLKELHDEFDDDWALALAAYNGGRGRIARAIKAAKQQQLPTDYWSLDLPRQTRRYVPRILALSQLLQHPEAYALKLPELNAEMAVRAVATGGQIELARAAELAGIELGELRELNPAHLRWATAPEASDVLWLPEAAATQFEQGVKALSPNQRVEWTRYQIAPGDSLIAIARRFNTQVQLLQATNDLDGHLIRAGDDLMIPSAATDYSAQVALQEWPPRRQRKPGRYRVRPGDSLWSIARRYGLSVSTLVAANGLDAKAYLKPGQTLRLPR